MDHPMSDLSLPNNDEGALGRVIEEHRDRLRAMLRRRLDPTLGRWYDPEDILQEVFLVAHRKWAKFCQSGMTPYAWLYRITLDCVIDAYRRSHRDRDNIPWPDSSTVQLGLDLVKSGSSPSQALARVEAEERMRQTVGLLRPDQRELLWMRHRDGLRFKEIAMILETTENVAIQRYHRTLKQLRTLWEKLQESSH